MKWIALFSVIVFCGVFFAVYGFNLSQPQAIQLEPPYAFVPNDVQSELLSLTFVFVFSALFFGFSAPLALGIEAAKFASLYSAGSVDATYLAFALPQVIVALSATYLGQGLLKDYQGDGRWKQYAQKSAMLLILALVVWVAVFFGRRLV
ncbi:hypothetical protein HY572_04920 [Candidatus Micrarchaeota archaeon]|nr:hypothetical protein [Candidatus Micrarchaeota archaeon]